MRGREVRRDEGGEGREGRTCTGMGATRLTLNAPVSPAPGATQLVPSLLQSASQ